jgi:O-antigen ligase
LCCSRGWGFESFWLGERLDKIWKLYKGLNEAHNGYLEIFLNLGWIGLTLLGVVIVTGYRNVALALRRDPDAGSLKLAYYVVGLVYSFTEAGFRTLTPIWIGFLLSTVSLPERRESSSLQAFDETAGFWTDAVRPSPEPVGNPSLAGQAPSWRDTDFEQESRWVEQV